MASCYRRAADAVCDGTYTPELGASFKAVSDIKTPIDADKVGGSNAFVGADDAAKFAASFVLVVDGKIVDMTTPTSGQLGYVAANGSAELGDYDITIPDGAKKQDVYLYYMGGSGSCTVKTTDEIASDQFASDVSDVVRTGVVKTSTAVGSTMDFASAINNGSSIVVTVLSDASSVINNTNGNVVTLDSNAGTAIFDVAVTNVAGNSTVYKTFEVTSSGTNYTCADITGTAKAANAAIAKDVTLLDTAATGSTSGDINLSAVAVHGTTVTVSEVADASELITIANNKITVDSTKLTGTTKNATFKIKVEMKNGTTVEKTYKLTENSTNYVVTAVTP